MICTISDLKYKDVINLENGRKIGFVSDVEIDTCSAQIKSLIIFGRCRLFGLLGRENDLVVCWGDIAVIGEDTILVKCKPAPCQNPPKKDRWAIFNGWFK